MNRCESVLEDGGPVTTLNLEYTAVVQPFMKQYRLTQNNTSNGNRLKPGAHSAPPLRTPPMRRAKDDRTILTTLKQVRTRLEKISKHPNQVPIIITVSEVYIIQIISPCVSLYECA